MKARDRLFGIALVLLVAMLSVSVASGCGSEVEETSPGTDSEEAGNGTDDAGAAGMDFSLTSSDFEDDGPLPQSSACADLGGDNISPQLSWQAAPQGTGSFALIMDDEDPPCGTGDEACRHWSIFNIPKIVTSLNAGQDISQIGGATQGENISGSDGYAGPCPPSMHEYRFSVYALDEGMPDIAEGSALTRSEFESRYGEHILASDTLSGSYSP